MAFDLKGFSRFSIGGSVGVGKGSTRSLYHYATNDTAAVVEATGYFNSMVAQMVIGDVIFASLNLGGAAQLKNYIVTANSGTAVTVAAQTTS